MILFVGRYDWANLHNRWVRALRKNGYGARIHTQCRHPFGYQEDDLCRAKALELAREADWVIYTGDHDDPTYFRDFLHRTRVRGKVGVSWCGTAYRRDPHAAANHDRELGVDLRIISPDMLRLAPDIREIDVIASPQAGYSIDEIPDPTRVKFGVYHMPSSRKTKGTAEVLKCGQDIEVFEKVLASRTAEIRRKFPIYVDQLAPTIGAFSCSAIEAMQCGNAVIADYRYCGAAWRWIEKPPIVQVDNARQLGEAIEELRSSPKKLSELRQESVEWCRRNATSRALAAYFAKHLELERVG